jgi:hypothetical protein
MFPALKASSPMAFLSRANFNLLSVVEGSVDIVLIQRKDTREKEVLVRLGNSTAIAGPHEDGD